jgi:hypothetical protein
VRLSLPVYDIRYALIKEYAQNYNTMTDEQANSSIKALDCNRATDGSTSPKLDARIRESNLPNKDRHVLTN